MAIGILSTSIASVGANVEFGPYVKLYGYFLYIYIKERPANTSGWEVEEQAMGAMYIDFGLYLTVKFKAQALKDLIKYEPTLYDGEFPLLTAGDKKTSMILLLRQRPPIFSIFWTTTATLPTASPWNCRRRTGT